MAGHTREPLVRIGRRDGQIRLGGGGRDELEAKHASDTPDAVGRLTKKLRITDGHGISNPAEVVWHLCDEFIHELKNFGIGDATDHVEMMEINE